MCGVAAISDRGHRSLARGRSVITAGGPNVPTGDGSGPQTPIMAMEIAICRTKVQSHFTVCREIAISAGQRAFRE
jgi:hypothetical protein